MNQMKMMQQVQKMQARMAQVQEDLVHERVEASAGGGAVSAVVDGQQRLLSVTIDPDLASEDVEMLQDLVVAAVNEAVESAKALAAARMQEVAAGLGLPPGLI
jgi:DNA-binding YbaB/EbfC family protein